MLDKNYLNEVIQSNFPDLANTQFKINNSAVSVFTEQSLLPFLVYQNTIDLQHRLIGLYLPESCSIINLIPFYIMMGQYRKALNSIMNRNGYSIQAFKSDQKQIIVNSHICSVSAVDFINRQLIIRANHGVTDIPFYESYKIKWYNNALDLRDKIESFEAIDKAANGNIFTFPLLPETNQFEGVIIFTNVSKFESLLKNVTVSGSDLRDCINIEKVVFSSNDDIQFVTLSKPKTKSKPVSLLIARQDAFKAYDSILAAKKDKAKHIKTIIIDDFDELAGRWEKLDSFEEEIKWLNENYFERLDNKTLKDMYFISRNSNTNIHENFKKYNINYCPWLLNPLEELALNHEDSLGLVPRITVSEVGSALFENLNDKLNDLISRWKALAYSSFCNGEIINPINSLYELRMKLNSFFDPDAINGFLKDFLIDLNELQKKWFSSAQDYNAIEETKTIIVKHINDGNSFLNFKLDYISHSLKSKNIQGMVSIVSDNNNPVDIKWALESLNVTFPGVKISCFNKRDFYIIKQVNQNPATIIFYLTSDRRTVSAAAGNVLANEQVFILNSRSYWFTQARLKSYEIFQKEAGNIEKKYTLLNVLPPQNSIAPNFSSLIPVTYDKRGLGQVEAKNAMPVEETEFQDLVKEIVQEYHQTSAKTPCDKFILFFDDGSLMEVPESKHFFVYVDDKEVDDFDKSFKIVSELEVGDQIVTTKPGSQIKDLLDQSLKKNTEFSHAMDMDEKWRILINNHIKRCGMDLNFFCKKLLQNGFAIGPASVRNWIDGNTRRPDKFKGLLRALGNLGIIRNDEIDDFDKFNSDLKSIQIKFVRTAIKRIIAKFNGIYLTDDDMFTDDLLGDFINHVEIKKILTLYKI